MKRKNSINKAIDKLTEPFDNFYLGFLASIGVSAGAIVVIAGFGELLKVLTGIDYSNYYKIAIGIFYLFLLGFTYDLTEMGKNKILRNGYILFAIFFILGIVYIWIFW